MRRPQRLPSSDYLTARAANPRTGCISPSVTSLRTTTPGTPGEALELFSLTTTHEKKEKKSSGPRHRWRCDDKGWWIEMAESSDSAAVPTAYPPPSSRMKAATVVAASATSAGMTAQKACKHEESEPHQWRSTSFPMPGGLDLDSSSHSATSSTSSDQAEDGDQPAAEETDLFAIRMPSAAEPQPHAFPNHTPAQIAAYAHYAEKSARITSQEYGRHRPPQAPSTNSCLAVPQPWAAASQHWQSIRAGQTPSPVQMHADCRPPNSSPPRRLHGDDTGTTIHHHTSCRPSLARHNATPALTVTPSSPPDCQDLDAVCGAPRIIELPPSPPSSRSLRSISSPAALSKQLRRKPVTVKRPSSPITSPGQMLDRLLDKGVQMVMQPALKPEEVVERLWEMRGWVTVAVRLGVGIWMLVILWRCLEGVMWPVRVLVRVLILE